MGTGLPACVLGKRSRVGSSEVEGKSKVRTRDEQGGACPKKDARKLGRRALLCPENQKELNLRKKEETKEKRKKKTSDRSLRSSRADSRQEVVESQAFTLQNVREAVRLKRPAIFNIDKSICDLKDTYVSKLVEDKRRYRTTTCTRKCATFQDVLVNLNGTLHIEEGVFHE